MLNLLVLKTRFRFIPRKTLVIEKVLDSPWVAEVEFLLFPWSCQNRGINSRVIAGLGLTIIGLICASELNNFLVKESFTECPTKDMISIMSKIKLHFYSKRKNTLFSNHHSINLKHFSSQKPNTLIISFPTDDLKGFL